MIANKKTPQKIGHLLDFVVPVDHRAKIKENKKIEKVLGPC